MLGKEAPGGVEGMGRCEKVFAGGARISEFPPNNHAQSPVRPACCSYLYSSVSMYSSIGSGKRSSLPPPFYTKKRYFSKNKKLLHNVESISVPNDCRLCLKSAVEAITTFMCSSTAVGFYWSVLIVLFVIKENPQKFKNRRSCC